MSRRGRRAVSCRQCGGFVRDVGQISRSGLCARCGDLNQLEAQRQLLERAGPIYERWLEGRRLRVALELELAE